MSDATEARTKAVAHQVVRLVVETDEAFQSLRTRFESLVPDIEFEKLSEVIATGDLAKVGEYTASRTPNSVANFWTFDPTLMMKLAGSPNELVTYMVGNNVIAETMFRHYPGVMLYAPLRFAIYTAGGRTFLSIDQPSTRFDSFGDPQIAEVGRLLDTKVAELLRLLELPIPEELTYALQ